LPVGGAPREPDGLGGLALSQDAEESELHQAGALGVLSLELPEGLIEREQVAGGCAGDLVEVGLDPLAAAPRAWAAACRGRDR
jgi:hypothetical protein